jgi:hypothetical protein
MRKLEQSPGASNKKVKVRKAVYDASSPGLGEAAAVSMVAYSGFPLSTSNMKLRSALGLSSPGAKTRSMTFSTLEY